MPTVMLALILVAVGAGCSDDRRRGADGGSLTIDGATLDGATLDASSLDAAPVDAGPASCPDGGQSSACSCGDGCLATVLCRDGTWECGGCDCGL